MDRLTAEGRFVLERITEEERLLRSPVYILLASPMARAGAAAVLDRHKAFRRLILAHHAADHAVQFTHWPTPTCDGCRCADDVGAATARVLANLWADHADFDPAWALP